MPNSEQRIRTLIRYCQIKISVIGRKSGKTISIPVCGTFLMNWGEPMKNKIV